MQITLDHVSHTYQPGSPFQATAMEDVCLTIREGEFLGEGHPSEDQGEDGGEDSFHVSS